MIVDKNMLKKTQVCCSDDRVNGISSRWVVGSIWVDVFINWILVCVSSISFEVLVNDGKSEQFKLSRGLRQSDPLYVTKEG